MSLEQFLSVVMSLDFLNEYVLPGLLAIGIFMVLMFSFELFMTWDTYQDTKSFDELMKKPIPPLEHFFPSQRKDT